MLWLVGIIVVLILIGLRQGATYVIGAMADAIKQFEGWYEGSRSWRNNNPGNLKYAGQEGAVSADPDGFAVFDSYTSGYNALLRQLQSAFYDTSAVYNSGMTLYEFFSKYSSTDQISYAEFVAGKLGVSAETTLAELIA